MLVEIKVPPLSESVTEATLLEWKKREGEAVARDENLIDIETDKIAFELPAPQSGVLKRVLKRSGENVTPGEVIALIETEAVASAPVAPAAAPTEAPAEAAPEGRASPAARKLIEEHGLEAARIDGSGRDGRITKDDVLAHIESRPRATPAPEAPAPARARDETRPEQRVKMTRLRARIAERLLAAQQNAAILTTFNEVNMQPVMDLRARYKERFEAQFGVKLGFMSFFIKASVSALKKFPVVNASIDGADVVYHGYYDIGVAVSTERGLVVPILRDADRLSFADIERAVVDFAQRAREAKLTLEDLSGGTFSLSNGGVFGSLMSTPILNPPQSAILGMHKIQERPVAEKGQVVIRPMMYLALSYDHRLVDGREAVLFLADVKEALEDPARLLLQV